MVDAVITLIRIVLPVMLLALQDDTAKLDTKILLEGARRPFVDVTRR
jgi:hypothetical protein